VSVAAGEIATYLDQLGQRPAIFGSAEVKAAQVDDVRDAGHAALSWLRDGEAQQWHGAILLTGRATARPDKQAESETSAVIVCDNPRLAFMKVVKHFFEHQLRARCAPTVDASADVHRTAVIGAEGQGYEWDSEMTGYVSMPHLAGVVIGPDVYVGPHSTIMRGALRDTRIGRGTKIGNGVNVGHGVDIGEHCIIVAHATIGGSSKVGDRVTIWQGAMIANRVRIGDSAVIGMGAVVLNDVPAGETWVGNPARKLR
jgi:UDP-3-O-[3-hydroxymyristoyl] glucosamine N-acyltransferase